MALSSDKLIQAIIVSVVVYALTKPFTLWIDQAFERTDK